MADKVSKIVLLITGDAKGAKKAFGDVGTAAGGLDSKLGGVGKTLGALGGAFVGKEIIGGLTEMGQAAAEDAQEQERLKGIVQNVTGATDAQVASMEAYILKTSLAAGVADGELRPALQNLIVANKDVAKGQEQFGIAMDVAQAKGLDLETVTKAMAKAHDGNSGALAKLGVATKDASGKTLTYDQLLKNLATTYGGAVAKNAATAAGAQERNAVLFAELKETIGSAVLPVMVKFGEILRSIAGLFTNLPGPVQKVIIVVGVVGAALVAVAAIVAPVVMVLGTLGPVLAAVGGAFGVLLGPVGLIILAIAAVGVAIYMLIKHWDDVKAAASAAVEWILGAWNGLAEPIRTALGPIVEIIAGPFRMAKLAVETAIKLIQAVVRGDFGAIPGILGGALRQVGEIMTAPFRAGVKLIKAALSGLVDIILWPFEQAMKLLEPIINAFKKVVALFKSGPDAGGLTNPALGGAHRLPQFALGGMVPGTGPQLAVVHGGERVLTPQQQRSSRGNEGILFTGPVTVVANNPQQLMDALAREASIRRRAGGGR